MYITATYIYNPIDPKRTFEPKLGSNPDNFIAEEVVSLVRNLRGIDLRRCNVILDVAEEKVVKCRAFVVDGKSATAEYDSLLEHFRLAHPQQIDELLRIAKALKEAKTVPAEA